MQFLYLIFVVEYLLAPEVVHAGVFCAQFFYVVFLFLFLLGQHRLIALDQIEQFYLVLPLSFQQFGL